MFITKNAIIRLGTLFYVRLNIYDIKNIFWDKNSAFNLYHVMVHQLLRIFLKKTSMLDLDRNGQILNNHLHSNIHSKFNSVSSFLSFLFVSENISLHHLTEGSKVLPFGHYSGRTREKHAISNLSVLVCTNYIDVWAPIFITNNF